MVNDIDVRPKADVYVNPMWRGAGAPHRSRICRNYSGIANCSGAARQGEAGICVPPQTGQTLRLASFLFLKNITNI